MNLNNEKAKRLLREIGEIDDELIYEAQTWRPRKRSKRVVLLAACLVLATMLVLLSIAILDTPTRNDKADDIPTLPEDTHESLTLDMLLCELKTDRYESISQDQLSYLSGDAYVVWQYESGELYISDKLSGAQKAKLSGEIGKGQSVGTESPDLECKIWIVMGDGQVLSPYLEASNGNVGIQVFDYEAEIYPTDEFISYVSEILG